MASIQLKNVRLSFPDLFQAVQYQGAGNFRYNASFLIEPGSENDKKVQAAIKEAAAEKLGKKADAFIAANKGNSNKFCYASGDTKDYDGYQGMLVLASHRKQEAGRPLIIGPNHVPKDKQDPARQYTAPRPDGTQFLILEAIDGKPYAGCYVNASVDIYAQDGQNAGIRCGLKGVQFAKDGDAFSGSAVAKPDDFEALEEGADAESLV